MLPMSTSRHFAFTNTFSIIKDEGVDLNDLPPLGLAALLLIASVGVFVFVTRRQRRIRIEKGD